MIVVLDTNLIVSGLLSPSGAPAEILDAWREGRFHLAISPHILREIEGVLHYPKLRKRHGLSRERVKALVTAMQNLAVVVHGSREVDIVKEDPSDNMFISCAIEAEADCIVSGDRHLLSLGSHQGIHIVPPREFLQTLRKEPPA